MLLTISILDAYRLGGKVGIIGIVCAFFGGCFILSYNMAGLLLLVIGAFLGEVGVNQVISNKEYV